MLIDSSLAPLGKYCGSCGLSNLGSLRHHFQATVVPPQHLLECRALSLGSTPLKLSYILAHIPDWVFSNILESGRYKLFNGHGLTLAISNFCRWKKYVNVTI